MGRIRRNNRNVARGYFPNFVADRHGGAALDHKNRLDVGMNMQWRTFSRRRIHDIGRDRSVVFVAVKFIRHPFERKLLEVDEAHTWKSKEEELRSKKLNNIQELQAVLG